MVLKRKGGVRKVAQWADTAHTQDPSLISGSCVKDTQLPTTPAAEDPTHSSGLWVLLDSCAHSYTHTCMIKKKNLQTKPWK